MSRIHEALKKAEQERSTGVSPEPVAPGPAPESTVARPPALPREPQAPPAGFPKDSEPTPVTAPQPVAVLTPELLLTQCRKPCWNPDPHGLLFVNSQNHFPGTEEFRTLRSRLYQIRDRQTLRTLLIASGLPNEGKTFTTANLAQVIVRQHERRALVIDADLRRSQLHQLFGAPAAPGLTDYLNGEADELSILQRGPTDNLFLIPGGKSISNPVELLSNGRLKVLLDRLAPLFDWILVDSPPAVAVSDASLIADFCDGVLLVVKAASTPFDAALKAREIFQDKPLLGVVLNRVERNESYQSYYYYYYQEVSKNEAGKR